MPLAYYVKLLGSLAVVIAMLAVVQRVSKFVFQRKYSGSMSVIDRLGIDVGVALMIVQVENKKYLMSLGGKDLRVLKELNHDQKIV